MAKDPFHLGMMGVFILQLLRVAERGCFSWCQLKNNSNVLLAEIPFLYILTKENSNKIIESTVRSLHLNLFQKIVTFQQNLVPEFATVLKLF